MATEEHPWGKHESERIEFKQTWSETAQKTMIAFANTYGGTIYFGVGDDGSPAGVDDLDKIERAVFSFARNGVEPDMSNLIRVKPINLADGKTVVAVQILLGDDRPYAFKNKSWTKGGVFIRVGSSSLQAKRSEIMGMAKDLIPWEPSLSKYFLIVNQEGMETDKWEAHILSKRKIRSSEESFQKKSQLHRRTASMGLQKAAYTTG